MTSAAMEKVGMFVFLISLLFMFLASQSALAYVGPGAGITMLGALWGVMVAIVLAIGAVLYLPLRAIVRRRRKQPVVGGSPQAVEAGVGSTNERREGRAQK